MEYNKEEYKKKFVTDILKAANYIVFFSDLIDSSINFDDYIHKYNKPEKRIKTINKLLDKCVKINMNL